MNHRMKKSRAKVKVKVEKLKFKLKPEMEDVENAKVYVRNGSPDSRCLEPPSYLVYTSPSYISLSQPD